MTRVGSQRKKKVMLSSKYVDLIMNVITSLVHMTLNVTECRRHLWPNNRSKLNRDV
jgi:hypothetical protein